MMDDYKAKLVEIADRIAGSSVSRVTTNPGDQARFLAAFRAAYRHLSQTVDGDPSLRTESETDKNAAAFWPSTDRT